jgi:hypothetical protein
VGEARTDGTENTRAIPEGFERWPEVYYRGERVADVTKHPDWELQRGTLPSTFSSPKILSIAAPRFIPKEARIIPRTTECRATRKTRRIVPS